MASVPYPTPIISPKLVVIAVVVIAVIVVVVVVVVVVAITAPARPTVTPRRSPIWTLRRRRRRRRGWRRNLRCDE